MSMELHVFLSKSRLPNVRQWQAAIDALGFDVKLDPTWTETDSGFCPAKFKGRDSGCEIDVWPASDVTEGSPELESELGGRDWSVNFRWGGDLTEMACALVAAAALTGLADGRLFDPQEGTWHDAAGALEQAMVGIQAAE